MQRKYVWGFRTKLGLAVSLLYDPDTLEPGEIQVKGKGPTADFVQQTLETSLDMDGHIIGTHTDPQNLEAFLSSRLSVLQPFRASPHTIPELDRQLPPGFIY